MRTFVFLEYLVHAYGCLVSPLNVLLRPRATLERGCGGDQWDCILIMTGSTCCGDLASGVVVLHSILLGLARFSHGTPHLLGYR